MIKHLLVLAMLIIPTSASAVVVTADTGRVIQTDKVAHIEREYDAKLGMEFAVEMAMTSALPGPRVIIINSPGGSVKIGLDVISLIKAEEARGVEVICVVRSAAHSMAFNTLTECSTRMAAPTSTMVVHKIRIIGDPGNMTAKRMRKLADELDIEDEQFRQANSKAMGLSLEDYDRYADNETRWSASTLKKRGYLHAFARIKK